MAYSTTYLYPEDLNGTLASNLIKDEPQTLQAPGPTDYYFIIPKAAPFFVDSLVVINTATGLPYVEGDDYQVGHQFIEAMDSIGRPIAGSIRFMRSTIVGQVKLTYRTIGGDWGFSDQAILRELSNKHLNPLIRSWGDIDVLPYSFPVLAHDQRIDSLVGSEQINATLIHIAEILEATAEGTSASHINDRSNPHQVTKVQVQLGNVPNFAMATDAQHTDGTRNDLFTNPRGVLLMINKFAVTPLNTHIAATGNVHNMVPADIGLGNVPNWLPATPAQAIDPTNNNTFMTPYTTSLLIQKLQNDPRLDQLIIDFNEHIAATNPHGITPQLIGTYTSAQIDAMIGAVQQGGDASTFGGLTPEEWEAMFPAVADINEIMNQLFTTWMGGVTDLITLDVTDPVTPDDKSIRESQKAAWAHSMYDVYTVYNALGDGKIMASTALRGNYPVDASPEAAGKFASAENAAYYIQPNGLVDAWGTSALAIPAPYNIGSTPGASNVSSMITASKDLVYLVLTTGDIKVINRSGTVTQLSNQPDAATLVVNNGTVDTRQFAIVESAPFGDVSDWIALGDAGFITAWNAVKTRASSGTFTIEDVVIGSNNILVYVTKDDVGYVWVYRINYTATITLTDVSTSTTLKDHSTGASVAASALTGVSAVNGSYTHFGILVPIGPASTLCDLYSFGDNSEGQLEITTESGPFRAVSCGYNFTVTVDEQNYPEFWGDSPDNALYWHDGCFIDPDAGG